MHKHGGNIFSYENILDFSANINFRGMPEGVRSAAIQGIDASVHYPDPDCTALRAALAERERLLPEEIICGNGAAELMFSLAFARRPKKALLAQPCFYEYEQALEAAGCSLVHHYMTAESQFCLGTDFLDKLDSSVDMVILGNPNNPTGQIISRELLLQILEQCKKNHIFFVADESFFEFLDENTRELTSECTSFLHQYPDVLVLKSFTKMYAMPGLRFGYGCCRDTSLLNKMRTAMQPWNVSLPAQMAARAAAGETAFAGDTAREVSENRRWMIRQMQEAGYEVFDSCTNYVLFQGPEDLAEQCLKQNILIRDCSNFRGLEKGFFRICIRSQIENERMIDVLRTCSANPETR